MGLGGFRRLSAVLAGVVFGVLLIGTFFAGVAAGPYLHAEAAAETTPSSVAQKQFGIFWQAWDIVEHHFVYRQSINTKKMIYGAISGMLQSLGDEGHTRFLSPSETKAEQTSLSGQFEGVGIEVNIQNGHPVVVSPIPGSPAAAAGLKSGDVILQVNGTVTDNVTLADLIKLIRGPAGTSVKFLVRHTGRPTPEVINVVRGKIKVAAVTWAMLPGTRIAQIQISHFSANAAGDLHRDLRAAESAGAQGLILDLRDDPGGLLNSSIQVASEFLDHGNVLLEEDASGHRTAYPVKAGGLATTLPLVVLVNHGTASASEIFAGAIQDDHRGVIIGQPTFGTGTVLSTYPLSDGSEILLGVRQWLTPDGRVIRNKGITPDESVALPAGAKMLSPTEASHLSVAALEATTDTQLLRGLDDLLTMNQ